MGKPTGGVFLSKLNSLGRPPFAAVFLREVGAEGVDAHSEVLMLAEVFPWGVRVLLDENSNQAGLTVAQGLFPTAAGLLCVRVSILHFLEDTVDSLS